MAARVHGVTAPHEDRGVPTGEELLHANRAVFVESISLALVVSIHSECHAAPAAVAVECVRGAAHPAYSAFVAVVNLLLLVVVVPELADVAVVARELRLALLAPLGWALDVLTLDALDLSRCKPVVLVSLLEVLFILVLHVIVAESAREELFTLLASLGASPSVVSTALLHGAGFLAFLVSHC